MTKVAANSGSAQDNTAVQSMRLAAAVENMAQGLCMFDAEQKLVICNEQYGNIYGLPSELLRPGTPHDEIIAYRIANGTQWPGGPEAFKKRNETRLLGKEVGVETVELKDGKVVEVRHQPMSDGGWVATHTDITDQRRNEARIRHLASHDGLTNLANRAQFQETIGRLESRLNGGERIAVLCVDLDHFKTVNDTLGHDIGDEVLRSAAERMRSCCRDIDLVARLGGDEFAVLQGSLRQADDAAVLARRIVEVVGKPYEIKGHHIVIGASIGIGVAPNDGTSAEALMKHADLALYRAKKEGRDTFHFFEAGMDLALQRRLMLEVGLKAAMVRDELRVVFQPLINLAENRICAFEALVRWDHPQNGPIPPTEFVPIAEETGLIGQIGEWVLREACAAAAGWPADIRVAVNLSPLQFTGKALVRHVDSALQLSGLKANRLELEVTESLLLINNVGTLDTLHRLRAMGVRISMDDFGTGYSSLSYLRSFPFDKLKIDRSFIAESTKNPESLAIVKAVIGLGRSLGMTTTAEGVETEAQLELARAEGATEVQGFLFSLPLPAVEVSELLSRLGDRPSGESLKPHDSHTRQRL
jgi:diguanylate cyclase (GGDEF)-like protein